MIILSVFIAAIWYGVALHDWTKGEYFLVSLGVLFPILVVWFLVERLAWNHDLRRKGKVALTVAKSRLHSKPRSGAKRRRKVVITPGFVNLGGAVKSMEINMRHVVCGLLIASTASVAGVGHLSLKVTAQNAFVKSGAKIMIRVATSNESDHPITYHNTSRDCDYSVRVLTSGGAPAPETPFKKQMDCSGGELTITGRNIVVTLKPGEFKSEEIEITELYDMKAPGEYSVQVERVFPEIGRFRSNAVNMKVAP